MLLNTRLTEQSGATKNRCCMGAMRGAKEHQTAVCIHL